MKVVITGATGFIGGAFAAEAARRGATIHALIRDTSDDWRLAGIDCDLSVGDIRQRATLKGLFEGADWVVHAAGKLGEAGVPDAVYEAVHVAGTRNVLAEVQRQAPHARVLHVSTPGILGPVARGADFPDETAPVAPTNAYERTKARGEEVALEFAAAGLDVVIMRPEFVYGPGDLHVLGIFRAIQRGFFFYIGDGRNTCHPTYVGDVVDGMLAILARGLTGEVYHITGPQPITWREFGTTVADALGVRAPWVHVPRWVMLPGAYVGEGIGRILHRKPPLSVTGVKFFSENRGTTWEKGRHDLGYAPRYDLADGARAAVAWYRDQGLLT